ncbi:class I adenylate-forming enzyme family protein [Rhabdothermincola sediminis]|uniref:class I adenylate-forming enzyme family protein n=1 Tax=Rhabdothermincola sediminis TaxID=2751370 RepID=UPI001AA0136A|nr:class I adenylate-forming enzyme family protein [Rhabdothermincola sediminis]
MATTAEIRELLTGPGGAFEVVTATIDGVEMKIYKDRLPHLRAVAEIAAGRGDGQPFIVYGDRRIGFGEFFRLANSVANHLREDVGVVHGDRVAVLSANNPEWCLTFWATVNSGAILVGLNGWWKADEILYGLRDSGARVLVADRDRIARIAGSLGELPELEAVYLIDAEPADVGDDPRLRRFGELTVNPTPAFPDTPIDEADYAVIFYTSGTTGRPKGAISSHRNMVANLQNTVYNTVAAGMADPGSTPDLRAGAPTQTAALLTSPLFHVSGCHSSLVVGTLGGVKLVIPEGRFEPAKALQLIQDEQVTIWATVPTMVWRVCEFEGRHDYDTSTVTSVAFGGSPSAEELQRMVRETFPNVRSTSNAYGLTETSSVATVINGQDAIDKPASVGPPVPVVDIRIVDANGNDVPQGQTGEVLIKGPIVMPGYWGKPEATAEILDEGGWLHTGDIGHLDADGYLYITDRAKDMIIRGGENVYCVEIEQRLVQHPEIADAAVVGVPHPELGEEVKAVIEVVPGSTLTERDVQAWVAETLANFKVPAYVELRTEKLPRNASGKLLKNVLRGSGEVSFAETM